MANIVINFLVRRVRRNPDSIFPWSTFEGIEADVFDSIPP